MKETDKGTAKATVRETDIVEILTNLKKHYKDPLGHDTLHELLSYFTRHEKFGLPEFCFKEDDPLEECCVMTLDRSIIVAPSIISTYEDMQGELRLTLETFIQSVKNHRLATIFMMPISDHNHALLLKLLLKEGKLQRALLIDSLPPHEDSMIEFYKDIVQDELRRQYGSNKVLDIIYSGKQRMDSVECVKHVLDEILIQLNIDEYMLLGNQRQRFDTIGLIQERITDEFFDVIDRIEKRYNELSTARADTRGSRGDLARLGEIKSISQEELKKDLQDMIDESKLRVLKLSLDPGNVNKKDIEFLEAKAQEWAFERLDILSEHTRSKDDISMVSFSAASNMQDRKRNEASILRELNSMTKRCFDLRAGAHTAIEKVVKQGLRERALEQASKARAVLISASTQRGDNRYHESDGKRYAPLQQGKRARSL